MRTISRAVLILLLFASVSQAAQSLTQFTITWTFDRDYKAGQFANGDYWVIGPVKIVSIEPKSTLVNGRIKNGSMVNPSPLNSKQGYDNQMASNPYDAALNVAFDVSVSKPLVLLPGSSLISTVSRVDGNVVPQLSRAAILTVLSEAAAPGSFRPPYCGADKTVRFNKSALNYSLLKRLPPVADTPALATVEAMFAAPWLDHKALWSARYQHPSYNMPDYGKDMHTQIGVAALMLHLDYTPEQKETLLCRFVQLGIDFYGIVSNGGGANWVGEGAHAGGRKWPILFAGIMLNDSDMKAIGRKSGDYLYENGFGPGNPPTYYVHFGEDDQTFYVAALDVAITHSPQWNPDSRDGIKTPYEESDIGMPEWGITHSTHPERSNRELFTKYRSIASAPFNGTALAALLMGEKPLWNHDALFDYTDRYMAITAPGGEYAGTWRSSSKFTEHMWDAYRAKCGSVWPSTVWVSDPNLPELGMRQIVAGQTLTVPVCGIGEGLTYSAEGLPTGATLGNGVLTWTPTKADVGTHTINIVSSNGVFEDRETLEIIVEKPKPKIVLGAPKIEIVEDGEGYRLTIGVPVKIEE